MEIMGGNRPPVTAGGVGRPNCEDPGNIESKPPEPLQINLFGEFFKAPMKLLQTCNEVSTKLAPSRIPCVSAASPSPWGEHSIEGNFIEKPSRVC